MSNGADAAEQIVRLSLDGVEVAARLTGSAAKNIALLLASVLKQEQKTKGKARLTNMIRSGKELKVFAIPQRNLKKFTEQAKRYGVLYTVLRDKSSKDGNAPVDIIARAEDAAKIQRIVDRFELGKVDKTAIVTEAQKASEKREAPAAERPVKTRGERIVEEAMGEAAKPERPTQQNPTAAKTDKSPPSERSSSGVGSRTDKGRAKPVEKKPSVRVKLQRMRRTAATEKEAERAASRSEAQTGKSQKKNGQTVHRQTQTKKKPKAKENER